MSLICIWDVRNSNHGVITLQLNDLPLLRLSWQHCIQLERQDSITRNVIEVIQCTDILAAC
jgi:hypothetical protein